MRRAALWLWLCALALRLQPALSQTVTTNVPPEDQDGSGDDSDNFSGSGAGALPDTMLHRIPSGKDMQLRTTAPTDSGATSTETVAASILPSVEGPKERGTVYPIELEPGLTVQEETSHPPSETTQHPTTHRASTARASTAQVPATTQPHRDVHPGHHETSAPVGHGHVNPPAPGLEEGGPSVTERTTENGDSRQPSVGDGSGEEDFVFEAPDTGVTGAVEPDSRNQAPGSDQAPQDDGATGASQGLLDRKEVLGGVIAGGLVGLIFAICLVGFMLYRMKKKDEGSYSLEEPKQANGGAYQKPTKQEEFYA